MWRRQDDRQCTLLEEDEVCWRFLGRADRQRQSGKQQYRCDRNRPPHANGHAMAAPPSSVMRSRRFSPSNDIVISPPASRIAG
jgi:hypothetical protein